MTMRDSGVNTDPDSTGTTPDPTVTTRDSTYTSPARRSYPSTVRDQDFEVGIQPASNLFEDRLRWGPIIGGLATALTSMLILSLLGLAIGLTTVNAGDAAASGSLPGNTGATTTIWGAVSAIISFLLGGFVAGRTASVFSRGWGALNGAMVFLFGVPVMLWLASQGLGSLMGAYSGYAGDVANNAQNTARNTTPADVARAAEQIRNGAWGSLLAAIVGLGASALGGYLGTRRDVDVDTTVSTSPVSGAQTESVKVSD
jgi:hypothetical protein